MEDGNLKIKERRTKNSLSNSKLIFLTYLYKRYFKKPLAAGISGFVLFFIFTSSIDFLVNIFNPEKSLTIDTLTIIIASTGFVLSFSFKLLEILKKD